jgi:hypothetical protein
LGLTKNVSHRFILSTAPSLVMTKPEHNAIFPHESIHPPLFKSPDGFFGGFLSRTWRNRHHPQLLRHSTAPLRPAQIARINILGNYPNNLFDIDSSRPRLRPNSASIRNNTGGITLVPALWHWSFNSLVDGSLALSTSAGQLPVLISGSLKPATSRQLSSWFSGQPRLLKPSPASLSDTGDFPALAHSIPAFLRPW